MSQTDNNNQSPTDALVHNGELDSRWMKIKGDVIVMLTKYHDKSFEDKQTFDFQHDEFFNVIDKHSEDIDEHEHDDGSIYWSGLNGETQTDIMRTLTLNETEEIHPYE